MLNFWCIFTQVLKALNYLKTALDVMHRDIKPSNILLNRNGSVKMCDFGISGHLVNSLAKTQVGTQNYMAVCYMAVNSVVFWNIEVNFTFICIFYNFLYRIFPTINVIWAVVIVWRIRVKIIRTVQCCTEPWFSSKTLALYKSLTYLLTVYHNCTGHAKKK